MLLNKQYTTRRDDDSWVEDTDIVSDVKEALLNAGTYGEVTVILRYDLGMTKGEQRQ